MLTAAMDEALQRASTTASSSAIQTIPVYARCGARVALTSLSSADPTPKAAPARNLTMWFPAKQASHPARYLAGNDCEMWN
jgi:hypothetical protein